MRITQGEAGEAEEAGNGVEAEALKWRLVKMEVVIMIGRPSLRPV